MVASRNVTSRIAGRWALCPPPAGDGIGKQGGRASSKRQCQVLLSSGGCGNNCAARVVFPCGSCSTPDAQLTSQGESMKIVTTLCCAALALCSAIYAQSNSDHITVHFNSSVMVGETKLPAGDCDIQVMHGNSNNII